MAESSDNVIVINSVNIQKQSSVGQNMDSLDESNTQKAMDPIFLDDSNEALPRTVLNLLSYLETYHPEASLKDILVGLIYILMLESGFVPIDFEDQCLNTFDFNLPQVLRYTKKLPKNWKKGGFYEVHFFLPGFQVHKCVLACCESAEDILVNFVVQGTENRHFSTCLDHLLYFSSVSNTLQSLLLQNLRLLSKTVKDSISYPAKQSILCHYDIFRSCFQALPSELIPLVVRYLSVEDFVHLGMTNKYFNEFLKTPSLWLQRIERDFEEKFKPGQNVYTYNQLIKMYKSLKRQRQIHNAKIRISPQTYLVFNPIHNYR